MKAHYKAVNSMRLNKLSKFVAEWFIAEVIFAANNSYQQHLLKKDPDRKTKAPVENSIKNSYYIRSKDDVFALPRCRGKPISLAGLLKL